MTIASAFNDIAVAQGGTAAKSGAITAAIDALNDALAGSDQPAEQSIEAAVRLLGEHIGGGGSVDLGKTAMLGTADGDENPILSEYRIGIGESVAAATFAPEMVAAACGASVCIVVPEIGGDPVTGDETVTASLIDGEPEAFTDFTGSLKDGALHIEFTMPNTTADDSILLFTITPSK